MERAGVLQLGSGVRMFRPSSAPHAPRFLPQKAQRHPDRVGETSWNVQRQEQDPFHCTLDNSPSEESLQALEQFSINHHP